MLSQILETGEEVRLQRNALSVTAHPTGLESVSVPRSSQRVNLCADLQLAAAGPHWLASVV